MYCCEDYGLSSIMSKLELCLLYACIYSVTNLFWRLFIQGGSQNSVYIKNQIYSSVNRGMYPDMFLG
jgi:hypothetical protein